MTLRKANGKQVHQEIAGRILVCSDVSADPEALIAEATSRQVALEREESAKYPLLWLDRLKIRGLDFRLFDPRGLYPGEDRMSFIFLESEVAPFLDGRLAEVDGREWCAACTSDLIRGADWFIQCPSIHLRYYLEEWIDMLLAWIKFFFIPELHYWRYDELPNYEDLRGTFEEVQARVGVADARRLAFDALLDSFDRQADEWIDTMKDW